MELSYWQSRWKKGKTGFHMEEGYPGLEKYWDFLQLKNDPVVLVPLCGKSKDLIWLSRHCRQVMGVEISEVAVRNFFAENNLKKTETSYAGFSVCQSGNITIWRGDFLKLPKHKFPVFDVIYDKAAFIALPPHMRENYAQKILELSSGNTQILLHLFEYRQEEMPGPPFSVSQEEIRHRFGKRFTFRTLEKKKLDLDNYKKFQQRGLRSYLIERLLLLSPNKGK